MDVNLFEPLVFCGRYLNYFGLHFSEKKSFFQRIVAHLMHIPFDLLMISLVIKLVNPEELKEQIAIFTIGSACLCFFVKLTNYWLQMKEIKSLVEDLKDIIIVSKMKTHQICRF